VVFTNKLYVKQATKTHAQVMKRKALEGRFGGSLLREYNKLFSKRMGKEKKSLLRDTMVHSFSILSDDRSKASSKTMPPHSAI